MSSELKKWQTVARSKIESQGPDIAKDYTLGWGGPLEAIELKFPHVSNAILDIRSHVSRTLPIMIYQTRQSPPKNMSVAVPYESEGDPYKCRLVSTDDLSAQQRTLFGEFTQAIWFSIDSGLLPHPSEGGGFEHNWSNGRARVCLDSEMIVTVL